MYVYDRSKTAADEIPVKDLPPEKRDFALEIAKKTRTEAWKAWEGVHGYTVEFKLQGGLSLRFTRSTLKFIAESSDFRWLECEGAKNFSVGM